MTLPNVSFRDCPLGSAAKKSKEEQFDDLFGEDDDDAPF